MEFNLFDAISPIDFRYFGGDEKLKKQAEKFLTETAMKKYMAKVEAILVKKLAEEKVIEKEIAEEIEKACNNLSLQKIFEEDKKTMHERRALVNAIRDKVSIKAKPFVHFTLTSNDVLDTANALRYKEFTEQVLMPSLIELEKTLIKLALQEKNTIQIGRTHGQHALPITFGSYLSSFVSRLGNRIKKINQASTELRGKISGAVGNYNALNLFVENPIQFEKELLQELGLQQAQTSSQIVEEEFLLDYLHALTSTLGVIANLADDLRHLQRTEIAELNEKFEEKQVGSSTMPHKRNPLTFENLKGIWKEFVPRMTTAYFDQISEHQRDLTNSTTKRFVPETIFITFYASETLRQALEKIELNKSQMKKNFQLNKNIILSEALQLLLSFHGFENAHQTISELTNQAVKENKSLTELVQQKPELKKYLNKFTVEQKQVLENPETYLGKAVEKTETVCEFWKKELGL